MEYIFIIVADVILLNSFEKSQSPHNEYRVGVDGTVTCNMPLCYLRLRPSCDKFSLLQSFIHPSIHFLYPLNPTLGMRGAWSLSQLSLGERQGTPWTDPQSITETNEANSHACYVRYPSNLIVDHIYLHEHMISGQKKCFFPPSDFLLFVCLCNKVHLLISRLIGLLDKQWQTVTEH